MLYCIKYNKYTKIKNFKMSYIFDILSLINNIEKYQMII